MQKKKMKEILHRPLPLLVAAAALLAAAAVLALQALAFSQAQLKAQHADRTVSLAQLGEIQARMLANADLLATAALDASRPTVERHEAQVQANLSEITRLWLDYSAGNDAADEQGLAARFIEARRNYLSGALRPCLAALLAGDFTAARRITLEALPPLMAAMNHEMHTLIDFQQRSAQAELRAAERQATQLRSAALAALVLGLLACVLLGRLLARASTP